MGNFLNIIDHHIDVLKKSTNHFNEKFQYILDLCINSIINDGKIILCGNGGSAADCQHFAAELIGRFEKERISIPAISLTTDTSIITAISNDYGFEYIFSRQIDGLGSKNDVLIVVSTSGNSQNIINAIKSAKNIGIRTIGLTGNGGGELSNLVDIPFIVPSSNTARIQEVHEILLHSLAESLENWI